MLIKNANIFQNVLVDIEIAQIIEYYKLTSFYRDSFIDTILFCRK